MAELKFAKPRPAALDRADRRKALAKVDTAESAKVKARSVGQCEVRVTRILFDGAPVSVRCQRRAVHVHHLKGGIGVRGRGDSALMENKLAVCKICHSDIHAHVLVRVGTTWQRRT